MADAACPGFKFAGVGSGVKPLGELDLALVAGEADLQVAAMFTQNRFRAASVELSEARVKSGVCRALVVNAGNANALVGEQGMQDAEAMTHYVARGLDCDEKRVLVASTGTVGRRLPIEPIVLSTPRLCKEVRVDGLDDFARAIQTSDQTDKRALRLVPFGKKTHVRLLGVAKGAGLLGPDLATTLAFVFTDAPVGKAFLKKALTEAVGQSFGRMSVDGEASTNDAVFALASGKAKVKPIDGGEAGEGFRAALGEVLQELARGVVRDSRGTSHVVRFIVGGTANTDDALCIATHLARSLPVKVALFGADPAWPRMLTAMGNTGVALDPAQIDIAVGEVELVRKGVGQGHEAEKRAHEIMRRGEYDVRIRVGRGKAEASYVGCDLSVEAVRAGAGFWL